MPFETKRKGARPKIKRNNEQEKSNPGARSRNYAEGSDRDYDLSFLQLYTSRNCFSLACNGAFKKFNAEQKANLVSKGEGWV